MRIQECMSEDVTIAAPAQTIRDAARMMRNIDAGFIPVGENDRLVGMITERDIAVRAIAEGKGPETPIRDVMSKEVLYCYEDDDMDDSPTRWRRNRCGGCRSSIAKSAWSGSSRWATSRRPPTAILPAARRR